MKLFVQLLKESSSMILHIGCHDIGHFVNVAVKGKACGKNMFPRLKCQKTDCWASLYSRKSGCTSHELASPQCFSSTLISTGLFLRMEKKIQRGWKDRNPFISLGCNYLHDDEGPECSAALRCGFVDNTASVCSSAGSLRGAGAGRGEEKGRSSTEGITHCENHTRSLLLLC